MFVIPIKNLTGVAKIKMRKTQENKLSMYIAVQKVCADNNSVWNGLVACSNAISAFENKISDIVKSRQKQESNNKGIAEDKAEKRNKMVEKAMFVKGAIQAYATATQNNELYENVNYSVTKIKRGADTIARDKALIIFNKATAIATNLADYGINTTVLSELETSINNFTAIMPNPRTAKSAVKAATLEITELFEQTDLILKKQLDKLMIQFKDVNEYFYNTYQNAREIIDFGKGSKTIEVELQPNELKTVQRVINGSVLKNTGKATLIYCADKLPPCDAGDEASIKIHPGEEMVIKIKENFITLRNIDTLEKAQFKVKVTSEVPVK